MFYRLSNSCNLDSIETELNATFRYPNLYEPKVIIDGKNESNIPIITDKDSKRIDFAIWGILPEDYEGEWHSFQEVTNTLNTYVDNNVNDEIYSDALEHRRCLIVVNGFFTSSLFQRKLHPHHVHLKDYKPFCIAGIYNHTHDGFLTCSVLVTNIGSKQAYIPNIGKYKPLIFKKKDSQTWLNPNFKIKNLKSLVDNHDRYNFVSHPIKEDFYQNTKVFERIVNSDNYKSVLKIYRN